MKAFTIRSALTASALFLAASLPAAIAEQETSKGCYSDSKPLKDQGPYTYQSDGYCQKECLKGNYAVFALWKGSNCLCGNELPAESAKTDDSKCNTACSGWPDIKCGGSDAYSVYLTGSKQNVDSYSSSNSSSTTSSSSTSTAGSVVTDHGQTTVTSDPQNEKPTAESKGDKSHNTAAIAAGVVVGVVGFCALIGAGFFLWRFKSRKNADAQFNRNAGVGQFDQPMSQHSNSDSRFDGNFMAQRRQSNGSIDDDQDFSRRILQVRNPDGGRF